MPRRRRGYHAVSIVAMAITLALLAILFLVDRTGWLGHGMAVIGLALARRAQPAGPGGLRRRAQRRARDRPVARATRRQERPRRRLRAQPERRRGPGARGGPAADPEADRSRLEDSVFAGAPPRLLPIRRYRSPSAWNLAREQAREALTVACPDSGYTRRSWPSHLPFAPPLEPMLAKAADALPDGDGWLYEPKWDGFRAHRLPRRRRGVHPEPRPQAARPLLPRAGRAAAGRAPGALRPRRRDRHRRPTAGSTSSRCCCASIRPRRGSKMLAEQSPASFVAWDLLALGDEDLRDDAAGASGERGSRRRSARRDAADPPHAGHDATGRSPPTGSTASRAPASTASSPSASTRRTSRASGRCSRSSTSAPPTAWSPASAGTRTGPARTSARCCSACTTTPARSTTSASPRRSPWERRAELVEELAPLRERRARRPPVAGVGRVGRRRRGRASGAAHARRDVALEPRQGPVVGAAADRAGRARSPTTTSRATASATATTFRRWRPDKPPGRLPLRPARGRRRRSSWRRSSASVTPRGRLRLRRASPRSSMRAPRGTTVARYRRHGPGRDDRRCSSTCCRAADVRGGTLLDIGPAIGGTDARAARRDGLERAVARRWPPAYQAAARDESAKRGTAGPSWRRATGDFAAIAWPSAERAESVTLDRRPCGATATSMRMVLGVEPRRRRRARRRRAIGVSAASSLRVRHRGPGSHRVGVAYRRFVGTGCARGRAGGRRARRAPRRSRRRATSARWC